MATAHPEAFTLIDRSASVAAPRVRPAPQSPRRRPGAHHPRLRRASGAHRIDGVGKSLALALDALPAGNLTFAGGIERGVANLDLTLSLVMADDQAIWGDAGPGQLERMRRRALPRWSLGLALAQEPFRTNNRRSAFQPASHL